MARLDLVAPRSLRDPVPLAAWLDRIDAVDPLLHAFLPEPGRRARMESAAGPPVAVKDIYRVDGFATRAGTVLPPALFDGPEASLVTRLRAAGYVVAGKTVTAEFASAAPGPTRNPHDPAHTPGGSSSGSAAAVAAGMVPVALGSQTLGSVVRPAAFCGVVGFRPTHGRVPADGMVPHSPSLDTVGWFTADVASAARVASVACPTWTPEAPGPPVLGVPATAYLARAGTQARAAFERQVDALRAAGFVVRTTAFLSDVEDNAARMVVLNRFELARTHASWFAEYGDRYRPQTVAAVREGLAVTPDDYAEARRWRRDFTAAFDDTGVDVWVTPAAPGTAPRGLDHTGSAAMSVPFSVLGTPALSVPAGRDGHGLPWGLQLAGARGADERLLAWAATIEPVVADPL